MRAMPILHDCYVGRFQSSDPWSCLPKAELLCFRREVRSQISDLKLHIRLLLLILALIFRTDLSKTRKILGFNLRRGAVFTTDGVVHFLAMNAHLFGGVDP